MNTLNLLALVFRYPRAGSLESISSAVSRLPRGGVKASLERFLKAISKLTPGEWEELYSRTLDLTPLSAPYVGYAIYGEDYRRGVFMAALNRAYAEAGVDAQGELPDHLVPVFEYLARTPNPLPELLEVLEPSVRKIHQTLKTLEPRNPYVAGLEAAHQVVILLVRNYQNTSAGSPGSGLRRKTEVETGAVDNAATENPSPSLAPGGGA